jgi:hypothetical protein
MFNKLSYLLVFTVGLMVTGCSQEAETPQAEAVIESPPMPLDQGLDLINRDGIETHLRYLADDAMQGRMTGTPEFDEAAAYVAKHFEDIGLEAGGEDGSWFQAVPMLARRIDVDSATVTFHQDGEEKAQRWKEDFVMGGDVVRDETNVTAEVVFVGFGIHAPEMGYSDYDGIDVEGKILALFGGAPDSFPHNERAYYSSSLTKATVAVERGAIGTIALRSRTDQKRYTWKRISENAGVRPGMSWINLSGQAANFFPELEGGALINVRWMLQMPARQCRRRWAFRRLSRARRTTKPSPARILSAFFVEAIRSSRTNTSYLPPISITLARVCRSTETRSITVCMTTRWVRHFSSRRHVLLLRCRSRPGAQSCLSL